MVDDFGLFALGVVADVCVFFSFDVVVDFFFAHVIYSRILFLLGDPHPPTYTHPPTLRGFCSDAHPFTLKCWVVDIIVLVGQRSEIPPTKVTSFW